MTGLSFWESKTLQQMSIDEWESLCDGCGKCCLIKIEDDDSGDVFTTNIACRLLDIELCRCVQYAERKKHVANCLVLDAQQKDAYRWLPETCAYRLLYEGKPLFSWHPLISGDAGSVHQAEISVRAYAQSEKYIHPEQHIEHIIGKILAPGES